jgi:hypothetical protein
MALTPDLAPQLDTAARGPASVSSDAGSVRQQPLQDLIAADRYQKAVAARRSPRCSVLFARLVPAGAFPDAQGTGLGAVGTFDSPGGIL